MRKTFQLFFRPEGAAGAGAGAGAADGKTPEQVAADKATADTAAADVKAAEDKKAADDKAAADKKAADDKAAADKKTADDAAAAEARKTETPEQKAEREKKEKAAAAPEKYALTVGKDAATFIDAEDLKTIEKVARDKGLTNDQAQALVDGRASSLLEQSSAFRAVTEADPDLGGDNLAETSRLTKLALDKLYPTGTKDGDAFRQLLQKTGYGNHRLVIKHFRNLGKQMAEDSPGGQGTASGAGHRDAASVLYSHPASQSGG